MNKKIINFFDLLNQKKFQKANISIKDMLFIDKIKIILMPLSTLVYLSILLIYIHANLSPILFGGIIISLTIIELILAYHYSYFEKTILLSKLKSIDKEIENKVNNTSYKNNKEIKLLFFSLLYKLNNSEIKNNLKNILTFSKNNFLLHETSEYIIDRSIDNKENIIININNCINEINNIS